jgi:multidrug resistance efflux pump
MKTLESKVRKAKAEYETLKAQYETLKSLNWDIFYGREEGVHDLAKEKDLLKKSVETQKKIQQLEAKIQAKKES